MIRKTASTAGLSGALLLVGLALFHPGLASGQDVLAGVDIFETDPNTTFQDFNGMPIPADFFGPGSDPFVGVVQLRGEPLVTHPRCPLDDLSNADTLVERLGDAVLPPEPSFDTIPIEIVELSLVSIEPITVTYGGTNDELWDLEVDLSPSVPSQGTMTIRKEHPNGGTFDSDFQVVPQFIFTKVSNPTEVRVLDTGLFGGGVQFFTPGIPWVYHDPPAGSCTSNFCANPGGLTPHQALFAAHGVFMICPEGTIPTRRGSWGSIKSLYQ